MTSKAYQEEVETVMNEFGSHDRICAVISDNTACCMIAREIYSKKYKGLVSVNDATHFIDQKVQTISTLSLIHI